MTTVVMVYKTGGDFRAEDVVRLAEGIRKGMRGQKHTRLLLTDDPSLWTFDRSLKLKHGWPGWWSKMEIFLSAGPCLYLDLDTVVTGDLLPLVDAVQALPPGTLAMLRGFYRPENCSGVMGWSGSMLRIYADFVENAKSARFRRDLPTGYQMGCKRGNFRGDQNWLQQATTRLGIPVVQIQTLVDGILSYKVDIQKKHHGRVPPGTRLVCLHGRPRIHELRDMPSIEGVSA